MITYHIPQHPSENPVLDDGMYKAVIRSVSINEYRRGTRRYVRIVLWLPKEELHLVTNVYLRYGLGPRGSELRLLRFCRAVGLWPIDINERPQEFGGRQLGVTLSQTTPEQSGMPRRYSDVLRFWPGNAEENHHEVRMDAQEASDLDSVASESDQTSLVSQSAR